MTKSLISPTLVELERTLDEVVSTLVAYRAKPPEEAERAIAGKPGGFQTISAADLLETDRDVLRARDVSKAPVEVGLKYAVKRLDKDIHKLVGDAGMSDVAERVASLDKDR